MKIILTLKAPYLCESVALSPGENLVESSPQLDRFLKNPMVVRDIGLGKIVLEEKKKKEKPVDLSASADPKS